MGVPPTPPFMTIFILFIVDTLGLRYKGGCGGLPPGGVGGTPIRSPDKPRPESQNYYIIDQTIYRTTSCRFLCRWQDHYNRHNHLTNLDGPYRKNVRIIPKRCQWPWWEERCGGTNNPPLKRKEYAYRTSHLNLNLDWILIYLCTLYAYNDICHTNQCLLEEG